MKFSFWDILATLVMLMGLAVAIIFINIFVNPYSFLNPFPPPTPEASAEPSTLTPTPISLPELWSATPETPGVPSVTNVVPTQIITAVNTRYVLPTRTATRTPNYAMTAYVAYLTAIKTATSSVDTTPPTNPGMPVTSSSTSDPTPTWVWTASTDSGSGMNYYQVTWGLVNSCNNTVYAIASNIWTAPALTTNSIYYICVRAVDRVSNASAWVGPAGFFYSGPVSSATITPTRTRTPTFTSTSVFTPTKTATFAATSTSTATLAATATSTVTLAASPTASATLAATATPTATIAATATATFTLAATLTDTATIAPTFTETATIAATATETATLAATATETATLAATATETMTPTTSSSFTITGNTGVGPTATPAGGPIAVVSITVTGDPGAVVTQPDAMGNYSVVVPANWSGSITPSRIGYAFTPVKNVYTNVNANISGQDFSSVAAATFSISGNVGAVPGATIIVDNGAVVTVQPELDGNYIVVVYSGWSGSIKATHATCSYTPPQYDYSSVAGDLANQNFNPACP